VTQVINALKQSIGNSKSASFGYTVPTGALGADSILQGVAVVNGNAKQVAASQKTLLKTTAGLVKKQSAKMKQAAGDEAPPAEVELEIIEGGKTVGNVKLDQFRWNLEMDAEKNPQAAQAQQVMAMVFGPNGMSGVMGPVNDNTFLMVQGGTDKLIQDAVAAAQKQQDRLGSLGPVKAVSSQLPKNRIGVFYVAVDQMVTSGVQYAQGFGMPLKLQLPKNLPPIGMSVASEGTAVRADMHVPTSLVQSLVAAGMQAYMAAQGGEEGAAPPDGL
jgi:hypothetical protein